MARRSYSFHIRKADHHTYGKPPDLHVHVYYNEGKSRKLLGRYRLPSLEPVFPSEPELNNSEIDAIRKWLAQPEQMKKLTDCLNSTLFDIHKLAALVPQFAEVMTADDGDTYINIRIPITRRIGMRS
jgi:hypothetical protein